MLVIALGAGSAGSSFMQMYPGVRRAMLLVSVGIVAMNLLAVRRKPMSTGVRRWWLGMSVLTVALIIWSVGRFGL
jgi:hypothetical protein